MIRTVLGDVPAEELGVCDAHDHLFMSSARLPGQELDDAGAAEEELGLFHGLGGRAVVQWTPYGPGRRARRLRPRLVRHLGEAAASANLVDNPARAFTLQSEAST